LKKKLTALNLSPEDAKLLDRIAVAAGQPRATVLRWALRHYALTGLYHWLGQEGRAKVLQGIGPLDTGIKREEVS